MLDLKLLRDFDYLYRKARPVAIGYAIGWCIGGLLSVALFGLIFFGFWRPSEYAKSHPSSNSMPYIPPGVDVYVNGEKVPH
jgi:quinol-cytochrome oxidoreductase complex cytochrome b subunit